MPWRWDKGDSSVAENIKTPLKRRYGRPDIPIIAVVPSLDHICAGCTGQFLGVTNDGCAWKEAVTAAVIVVEVRENDQIDDDWRASLPATVIDRYQSWIVTGS